MLVFVSTLCSSHQKKAKSEENLLNLCSLLSPIEVSVIDGGEAVMETNGWASFQLWPSILVWPALVAVNDDTTIYLCC